MKITKKEKIIDKLLTKGLFFDQQALSVKSKLKKEKLSDKSRIFYQKALSLNKNNQKAILGLARIYLHKKNFSSSLNLYKETLNMGEKDKKHLIFNGIGNVYRYMGDWDKRKNQFYKKAVNYYLQTIKNNPDKSVSSLYWSNLSRAFAGLQNWNSAIKANEQALKFLKNEKVYHSNLKEILILENKLYKEYRKRTLS